MKLLKLYKPSCSPCGEVENYLKDKHVEYTDINVFEDVDTAIEYGVMSAPVTILLNNEGEEVARVNGYKPRALEELINRMSE